MAEKNAPRNTPTIDDLKDWAAPRFPDCRFRVHLRGEL